MTLLFAGKEKRSGREEDAEVRLKEEVRSLAWQLLGPPPDHKPTDMVAEIIASGERMKTAANPKEMQKPKKRARRPRASKSDTIPPAEAGPYDAHQGWGRAGYAEEGSPASASSIGVRSMPRKASTLVMRPVSTSLPL